MICKLLFIGDIVGQPGREVIKKHLPDIRSEFSIDCVVGNAENIANGKGIEPARLRELMDVGVDVFTSGNHVWDKKDVYKCFEERMPLLCPANYPRRPGLASGPPYWLWKSPRGFSIAIINLMGRVFMDPIDCPFQTIDLYLEEMRAKTPLIFVDMHCEASSEKAAMAWYLDGKVSAVLGSHTHVPTADARLLPNRTAFQTDAGMTGPYDSIIGMEASIVIEKFLTKRPKKFEVAKENAWLSSICVSIDTVTGMATEIVPVRRSIG